MSRFPEPIQIFADKINSNIAQQFQRSELNQIESRGGRISARAYLKQIIADERAAGRRNYSPMRCACSALEFINQDRAFEGEILVPTIRPRSRPCRERPGRRRGVRSARETANTIRSRARPRGRTRPRPGRRRVRRMSSPTPSRSIDTNGSAGKMPFDL